MGDSGSPTGLVEGEAVAEGEGHMFWFLLTRHLGEGGLQCRDIIPIAVQASGF